VRIDYGRRQVEVDGEVVLREGLLELFACSPNTREYESIVRLDARPTTVFQALGLIGLSPGHPLRINPQTAEIVPPDGDPVRIEVRYRADGLEQAVPIENWMRHSEAKTGLPRQEWVFAGSFPVQGRGIAADEEGTIIAVVDFQSAVIALPRHHTASNAELWLEPNTPAIPPVGTPCTVIMRPGPLRVRLDRFGRLYLGTRPVTFAELAGKLRTWTAESPKARLEVETAPESPAEDRELLDMVLEQFNVSFDRRAATSPAPVDSSEGESGGQQSTAAARWILGTLTYRPPASVPAQDSTTLSSAPAAR